MSLGSVIYIFRVCRLCLFSAGLYHERAWFMSLESPEFVFFVFIVYSISSNAWLVSFGSLWIEFGICGSCVVNVWFMCFQCAIYVLFVYNFF